MNKIFIVLIVAIGFLVGCGEKDKNETKKITFWHFWSEPYQRTVVDSLVKEFEKQEKVEVEVTELSWGDGKVKLLAAFNSNTAPDVLEKVGRLPGAVNVAIVPDWAPRRLIVLPPP